MKIDIEYLGFLRLVSNLALYRDVINERQDAAIRECVVALVLDQDCPDAHFAAMQERDRIYGKYIESCKYSDPNPVPYLIADAIRWLCEFDSARAWDCLLSAERH